MKKHTLALLLIWLLQACLVVLLVYWNPNHFTTIDSGYYLDSALQLLSRNGYTHTDNGRLVWNGTFPVGYPAAIAFLSACTGLSTLWASKGVNLLVSGVFLYLLGRWYAPRTAVGMGSILLLGQFVKLWAHTWSEPMFLVLLFVWVRWFFVPSRRPVGLFLLGIALLLVRYAGAFILPLSFGMALYAYLKKQYFRALQYMAYGLGWSACLGAYLYLNFYQSGEWYGGARFTDRTPFLQGIGAFGKGLLNELFLFRDFDFSGPDGVFLSGLVLQLALVAAFFGLRPRFELLPGLRSLWITAGSYLLFLFLIRLVSPFDAPGYRLLSPFSFLFSMGIVQGLRLEASPARVRMLLTLVLLASWLHLLPQADLLAKLGPIWDRLAQ